MQENQRIAAAKSVYGVTLPKYHFLLYFLFVAVLLFTGEVPSPAVSPELQRQLDELSKRGITHRFLDANTIELYDPPSGTTRVKTLQEPSTSEIYAWASSRGIPILEIDPSTIDTSKYTGMYTLWTSFPLSSTGKSPLVISDFNLDGKPEACGISRSLAFPYEYSTKIYTIDSNGQAINVYTYSPYQGIPVWWGDVDGDMLKEVMTVYFELFRNFEQVSATSLPTEFNFVHATRPYTGGSYSGFYVGNLDNDDSTDFLYVGARSDSQTAIFVTEYRQDTNNFVRIWDVRPDSLYLFGGFAVGDFDNDSLVEFAFGEIDGRLFVGENTGNNIYEIIWQDTTPFFNLYYMTQGDVDSDGLQEFFMGASMWNGIWTTGYEADSNNHYSPKFLFHLLSGGFPEGPTHLTSDLDNDGQPELIIYAASDLYVFKSSANDDYHLWYYRRAPIGTTVQTYNFFDQNGQKSLVVSRDSVDSLGRLHIYSEIYRPGPVLSVDEKILYSDNDNLLRNYPNPFNSTTSIEFSVPLLQPVKLTLFNILGQEIAILVNGEKSPGKYRVEWDASQVPSGIYFYRLQTENSITVRKMVLCK